MRNVRNCIQKESGAKTKIDSSRIQNVYAKNIREIKTKEHSQMKTITVNFNIKLYSFAARNH